MHFSVSKINLYFGHADSKNLGTVIHEISIPNGKQSLQSCVMVHKMTQLHLWLIRSSKASEYGCVLLFMLKNTRYYHWDWMKIPSISNSIPKQKINQASKQTNKEKGWKCLCQWKPKGVNQILIFFFICMSKLSDRHHSNPILLLHESLLFTGFRTIHSLPSIILILYLVLINWLLAASDNNRLSEFTRYTRVKVTFPFLDPVVLLSMHWDTKPFCLVWFCRTALWAFLSNELAGKLKHCSPFSCWLMVLPNSSNDSLYQYESLSSHYLVIQCDPLSFSILFLIIPAKQSRKQLIEYLYTPTLIIQKPQLFI